MESAPQDGHHRIEDYALIGNCQTVALVGCSGSIDWLCLPRFDSNACFAALLGGPDHGRWLIAPIATSRVTRAYRDHILILDTTFETDEGRVCVTDFMSRRDGVCDLVRLVKGLAGRVRMRTELKVRFEYGSSVPWVTRQQDGRLRFIGGPDQVLLQTPIDLRGEDLCTVGEFYVTAGDEVSFTFSWAPSYLQAPAPLRSGDALVQTESFWHDWTKQFKPQSESADSVLRSLLVLKALSHRDTGGMVAAATTSLPECLGGARNWDYRYCWLRDATFTLYALIGVGCLQEARAWRDWLIRAVGGNPNQIQVLYGLAGERRVPEYELPWLPGYENSAPVRIGNAAAGQLQIDVYGEVMDALYLARKAGLGPDEASWALECALLEHLETIWHRPDHGMWEVRGKTQQFTHSKVMAWVAFDRALRSVAEFGLEGPSEHWRAVRDRIHQEVCERGFNVETQTFVQYFGGTELDANLLRLALVGFLPPEDPRIRSTVTAIERDLMCDGLVLRYRSHRGVDEVRGEGAFLACSFWLADNYVLQGRNDEARELFQRLLSLRNDVGLLAEEYDSKTQRQVGNFPQAFSHLSLINTALNLAGAGPAHKRSARKPA